MYLRLYDLILCFNVYPLYTATVILLSKNIKMEPTKQMTHIDDVRKNFPHRKIDIIIKYAAQGNKFQIHRVISWRIKSLNKNKYE